jgi:hypothetical protein
MAWPPAKKKAKAKKPEAKRIRKASPAIRVVKRGSLWFVTVGGRAVSNGMKPESAAKKKAAELRAKRRAKNPAETKGQVTEKVVKQLIAAFDVDRDGKIGPEDVAALKAAGTPAKGPVTIKIADILGSNGEQTIADAKKSIKGGYRPQHPDKPIIVVKTAGGKYLLTDGFHRTALRMSRGDTTIKAIVRKANPGLISMLAELGVAVTSGMQIHQALSKKNRKRPAKRRENGKVRSTSPRKNPAKKNTARKPAAPAKKPVRTAKTNPVPATVQAFRIFHEKGLPAAKTFITKTRDLTEAQKRELRKDLESYHKPPTINPSKKKANGLWGAVKRVKAKRKAKKTAKSLDAKAWTVTGTLRPNEENAGKRYQLGDYFYGTSKADVIRQARRDAPAAYKFTARLVNPQPKKNAAKPAPAKTAVRSTAGKKTVARKRNPSGGFEAFQGREHDRVLDLTGPRNMPARTWTLGELEEIRIAGRTPVDFTSKKGEKYYVLSDNNDKGLYIAGTRTGRVANPDERIADGTARPIGPCTHITYKTLKAHLDDTEPVSYEHKFGEEGGERPTFAIDREGYAHIIGGDFEITPLGIRD